MQSLDLKYRHIDVKVGRELLVIKKKTEWEGNQGGGYKVRHMIISERNPLPSC